MGVYCVSEMVKRYRKSLCLTQEKLSEGICSVETLSRFENGRQTPGHQVYQQLMEHLGKNKNRVYAIVSGRNFTISDMVAEYEDARNKSEYKKEDKILRELEEAVDDSLASRQYVMAERAVLDMRLKRISAQEGRAQLRDSLELTAVKPQKEDLERYPFTDYEMLILYYIADTYFVEKRLKEGAHLLEKIRKKMKSCYCGQDDYLYEEILITERLVYMNGELGNYRKAVAFAEEALKICRKEKYSVCLPQLLSEMEWNMEQLLKCQEEEVDFTWKDCQEILKMAYYLSAALGQEEQKKQIYSRYIENFPYPTWSFV